MDQALKQRLMGALVLVLLAMIILPIVFEGNRKYDVSRTSQLPPAPQYAPVNIADPVSPTSPPSGKPLDQMFDMSAPADSTSSSDAITPVEAATVDLTAPQTNTTASASVAVAPKATPAASVPKPATTPVVNTAVQQRPKLTADGLPEGWIVQMGVFSDTNKANSINRELLKRKYPVFLRKIATPKSTGTKIAIGPFVDRKQADRVKSEVDALYHVNAIIVRFQP